MSRWLLGVLFVPLVVVIVLASMVVNSQSARRDEAARASNLASLALEINELDQALGAEALAATEVISDPTLWDGFLATHAAETDTRLAVLEERVRNGVDTLQAPTEMAREVLSFRQDIPNGQVTPLQLADRYGQPRAELFDVLVETELEGTLVRLTALMEARSAHLDERFSSQLAIRYGGWERGQRLTATTAVGIQLARLDLLGANEVEENVQSAEALFEFRAQLALSRDVPDVPLDEYAAASDRWLEALNDAIDAETTSIDQELRARADQASLERTLTIIGVAVGTSLAFITAFIVSYRIVARLHRLTEFASRVGQGERDLGRVSDDVEGTDELAELARVIDDMLDEVRHRDHRLAHQARTDDLTGLLNRRAILQQWRDLVAKNDRSGFALAIDLDGFKSVNDQYGHLAGDSVLTAVAGRLLGVLGSDDVHIGRVGGDEFLAIISSDSNDSSVADQLADELLKALRQPFKIQGNKVALDASIGIVESRSGASATELLSEADLAMYESKSSGGGLAVVSDQALRERAAEIDFERIAVRTAIENDQFVGAFQPIVGTVGDLLGFEALARWQNDGTLVEPAQFIASIEHGRLFPDLDELMLRRACEALASWCRSDSQLLRISVNISTQFLETPGFVSTVLSVVDSYNVDHQHLILEITESSIMSDECEGAQKLDQLRRLGFSIAIDDYGTGYSSLSYLQRLPIDFLKLDSQFVEHIDENPASQAIARSVLTMAADLNVECIIEGVERQEEHEWFVQHGASFIQGYLHGRPEVGELARSYITEEERSRTGSEERV